MKKKKLKSVIAAVLALSLCVSLSACGDSGESGSTADNDSVSADNGNADSADEGGEADSANDDSSNALYAYYDDLAAEFEKEGDTSIIDISVTTGNFKSVAFADNKLIFVIHRNLYTYDIDTKEKKEYPLDEYCQVAYYYKGFIYAQNENRIVKFDTEGNILETNENAERNFLQEKIFKELSANIILTETGCIFQQSTENNKPKMELASLDFQTVTEVPAITDIDSHGLETEVSFKGAVTSYQNKIYVIGQNSTDDNYYLYYLDTDSMAWNKALEEPFPYSNVYTINNNKVGKYLLGGNYIYNMETDEYLVQNLPVTGGFGYYYSGGKYNIRYDSDAKQFCQFQVPSEGAEMTLKEQGIPFGSVDASSGGVRYCLNDTYYVYKDDAGIFLRTYEKGDSEEEMIHVY